MSSIRAQTLPVGAVSLFKKVMCTATMAISRNDSYFNSAENNKYLQSYLAATLAPFRVLVTASLNLPLHVTHLHLKAP